MIRKIKAKIRNYKYKRNYTLNWFDKIIELEMKIRNIY